MFLFVLFCFVYFFCFFFLFVLFCFVYVVLFFLFFVCLFVLFWFGLFVVFAYLFSAWVGCLLVGWLFALLFVFGLNLFCFFVCVTIQFVPQLVDLFCLLIVFFGSSLVLLCLFVALFVFMFYCRLVFSYSAWVKQIFESLKATAVGCHVTKRSQGALLNHLKSLGRPRNVGYYSNSASSRAARTGSGPFLLSSFRHRKKFWSAR